MTISKVVKHKLGMALAVSILTLLSPSMAAQSQRKSSPGFVTESTDIVFAIAFSPDAKTLAIARGARAPSQRFGRVELWNTANAQLRHVIKGFDGPVRSISFSPDGKTLVTGSIEFHAAKLQQKALSRTGEIFGELKWWDAETGELRNKQVLPGEGNSSIGVNYSPNGKELVVIQSFQHFAMIGSDAGGLPMFRNDNISPLRYGPTLIVTGELRFLDSRTGEQRLKVNVGPPGDAVFSPDGSLVATPAGKDIKIYETGSAKEIHKVKDLRGIPTAIAFSPDSQNLAVVSTKFDREFTRQLIKIIGRSEVKIFDVHDWKMTMKLNDLGAVRCLAYEPKGHYLILGGMLNDNEKEAVPALKIWNLQSRSVARFPTGGTDFSDSVQFLAIGGKGGMMAFTSGADKVQLLETDSWQIVKTMDATSVGDLVQRPVGRFLLSVKTILEVAFNPEGNLLTAETDQGEIKQWDTRTGEVKFQLNGGDDPSLVTASSNARSFAELFDGDLTLWSSTTNVRRPISLPHQSSATAAVPSHDGSLMAVAISGSILILDVSSDTLIKTLTTKEPIDSLAFASDNRTLAAGEATGSIELWDIAQSRMTGTIATGSKLQTLKFSPSGQILAVAGGNIVTLWDTGTHQAQRKLQKHDGPVNALAFSSNGQLLASGSDDRTAIIWDVATGQAKRTLKGHDQTVRAVAFSSDGRLLASGSGNSSVVLWNVKTGDLNRVLK